MTIEPMAEAKSVVQKDTAQVVTVAESKETTPLRSFMVETMTNLSDLGQVLVPDEAQQDEMLVGISASDKASKSKTQKIVDALVKPVLWGRHVGKELIEGNDNQRTRAVERFYDRSISSVARLLDSYGMKINSLQDNPLDVLAKVFGVDKKKVSPILISLGILPIIGLLSPRSERNNSLLDGISTTVLFGAMIGMTQVSNLPPSWDADYLPGEGNLGEGKQGAAGRKIEPVLQVAKSGWEKVRKPILIGGCALLGLCIAGACTAGVLINYEYQNNPYFKVMIDSRAPATATPKPEPSRPPLTDAERFQLWVNDNYVNKKDEANPLDIKVDMVKNITAYVGPTWMWKKERLDYLNQVFGDKFKAANNRDINEVDVIKYSDPNNFVQLLKDLGYDQNIVKFYEDRTSLIGQPDAPEQFLKDIKNLGLDVYNFLTLIGFVSATQSLRTAKDIDIPPVGAVGGRRAFLRAALEYGKAGAKTVNPALTGVYTIARFLNGGISDNSE